jgi:hypothetical protein
MATSAVIQESLVGMIAIWSTRRRRLPPPLGRAVPGEVTDSGLPAQRTGRPGWPAHLGASVHRAQIGCPPPGFPDVWLGKTCASCLIHPHGQQPSDSSTVPELPLGEDISWSWRTRRPLKPTIHSTPATIHSTPATVHLPQPRVHLPFASRLSSAATAWVTNLRQSRAVSPLR